ncbi:hypothetical protein KR009_000239 [Drosophila setifemur]|nr:hypothetical protein KR009_000239 [Drosophila setifemur]
MLILHLLLWSSVGLVSSNSSPSAAQKAEIAKLRSEISKALEEDQDTGVPAGVIVAPVWTQQALPKASPVVVDASSLASAAAVRQEIQTAVQQQGQAPKVVELEVELMARGSSKAESSRKDQLGATLDQEMLGTASDQEEPNVVESSFQSGIDLEQLQRLELSKRRTRDMLVLSAIEELMNFTLPANVDRWVTLQSNGSGYLVGKHPQGFLVLSSADFTPLQNYEHAHSITALLGLQRWSKKTHKQVSILLMCSQDQLTWLSLDPEQGLVPFWHWPLGAGAGEVTKLGAFSLAGRDYLVMMGNRTLSLYAYDMETEDFWIAQRLQLPETISDLAILDTGRELLLAVGQLEDTRIYGWSGSGEQLQLRQSLDSPQVTGIISFQMGGRTYLALGGKRPQILAYIHSQLVPRTILGQNFGFVERFMPVPVRSYRDDLLLLVQHRVFFEPHSLLVLEVLVWNGEAFEAGLPPLCGLTYGAGCMLDQERNEGITGAALLRRLDQPPLVLVPRQQAPSGLFRLETKLLARNSEAKDLQEIHQFMLGWVQEQDELLHLAEKLLKEEEEEHQPYENVTADLVISEGETVQELFVNDARYTGADAKLDMNQLLAEISLLEEELPHKRSKRELPRDSLQSFHYEHLEVEAIEAEELLLEQLNKEAFYVQNSLLELPLGSLNVQQLEVLEAALEEPRSVGGSETHETLSLTGDLEFGSINGLEWSKLLEDLVWRDKPLKLNDLYVEGPLIFEDALHLKSLNRLSFPGDFLWSQGNETTVVQAPKEFRGTLSANAVDTAGTINGVHPLDVITLGDAQDWPGWVTFSHLEVSEELELNGSAQGRQVEDAPLNPTLLESRLLHANCHFEQLIVKGKLLLQGKLEKESFSSLLGDLVQRETDSGVELQIRGGKRISELHLPVDAHVADDQLSGVPLEYFVTKHTTQTLTNLSWIGGYVYFHSLTIPKEASFDGVRLDQLLEESLRLDGQLPLASPLTRLRFAGENPPDFAHLQVNHSLNQVPLSTGYQLLKDPLHLSSANFTLLKADQAQVNQNVTGLGLLNGKDLKNLLLEQPRTWSGEVHVQELILSQGVRADELQGLKAELLLDFLHQLDDLPLHILQGRLQVESVMVSGSVQVMDTLNGRDFNEILRQVVWLDRPNDLRTRWTLQDAPEIGGNLVILGSFNERLLPELLDDIVLKTEGQEVLIKGPKSFLAPVKVDHLNLAALNGIPFEQIPTKTNPVNLSGNVQLEGRLYVDQLKMRDRDSIRKLEDLLLWDPTRQSFIQRGVIQMPAKQLEQLSVMGHLGNGTEEPVQQLLDQLIFKQQERIHVQGHKIFTGRVRIEEGAHINHLDNVNLAQLLDQLILIDSQEEEVTIQTPLRFVAPVRMDHLHAEHLVLSGELLNGCNVTQWLKDTVRVDREWPGSGKVTFAQGSLDGNYLKVDQLNQVELSRVLTRHTEQVLRDPLQAEEIFLDGEIVVEGRVNGQNLSEKYSNTLMRHPLKQQRVETPLFLSSLNVSESLEAPGSEGFNLSDVATLGEDVVRLQSPLYFAQLHAFFLKTKHPLNGFDFRDWYERSLWAGGREQQEITGSWRVKELRVKQAQEEEQRPRRQTPEESYRELCQSLVRITLPYQLQKLRKSFSLRMGRDQGVVRRVFPLGADADGATSSSYLLINELGCWTRIYKWNGTAFHPSGAFQSGPVDEVVALRSGKDQDLAFLTNHEMGLDESEESWNCTGLKIKNLMSWRMDQERNTKRFDIPLERIRSLKEQLQRSSLSHPSYQRGIRYLKQPSIASQLGGKWQETELKPAELARIRKRLLDTLEQRLQAEVHITQLSIPESDLFDEHLVEDFLDLTHQLRGSLGPLNVDTLPLPDSPARVLAARSGQLIWPVLQELRGMSKYGSGRDQHQEVILEQALIDVLRLANGEGILVEQEKLHAVIRRLRMLHEALLEDPEPEASPSQREEQVLPLPSPDWRPVQTVRLLVGPAHRAQLLYARLTLLAPPEGPPPTTPSSAPAAHIQLHHANGSLFQSLAAERGARYLSTLRVRDETLLAFVEGCCRIKVMIYRGVQGFVPFARFRAPKRSKRSRGEDEEVLQLFTMRLPLQRPPGAMYTLAVAQAKRITFYELVIAGLLEPWLKC